MLPVHVVTQKLSYYLLCIDVIFCCYCFNELYIFTKKFTLFYLKDSNINIPKKRVSSFLE